MLAITKETSFSNGPAHGKLIYTLLEGRCSEEEFRSIPVYGIRTELLYDGKLTDSCEVCDVTTKKDMAAGLLELLSRNTVTPCTLKDVVEDFLVQCSLEDVAFAQASAAEPLVSSSIC